MLFLKKSYSSNSKIIITAIVQTWVSKTIILFNILILINK